MNPGGNMTDERLFENLVEAMQEWRDEDNKDWLSLSRNEVIILLEGIYRK